MLILHSFHFLNFITLIPSAFRPFIRSCVYPAFTRSLVHSLILTRGNHPRTIRECWSMKTLTPPSSPTLTNTPTDQPTDTFNQRHHLMATRSPLQPYGFTPVTPPTSYAKVPKLRPAFHHPPSPPDHTTSTYTQPNPTAHNH